MAALGRLDDVSFLVLDDHANMRKLWRTILGSMGARDVFEAQGGAEAFDFLRNSPVDVAIVDHVLPDLSGVEFISLLRTADDSPVRHLPIVACTAHTRRSVIKELVDAGADEVLAKPVSVTAASEKINRVLSRRRSFVDAPRYYGPDRRRRRDDAFDPSACRRGKTG